MQCEDGGKRRGLRLWQTRHHPSFLTLRLSIDFKKAGGLTTLLKGSMDPPTIGLPISLAWAQEPPAITNLRESAAAGDPQTRFGRGMVLLEEHSPLKIAEARANVQTAADLGHERQSSRLILEFACDEEAIELLEVAARDDCNEARYQFRHSFNWGSLHGHGPRAKPGTQLFLAGGSRHDGLRSSESDAIDARCATTFRPKNTLGRSCRRRQSTV
jgi:hypothetical protein